jgi:hypothetical protein
MIRLDCRPGDKERFVKTAGGDPVVRVFSSDNSRSQKTNHYLLTNFWFIDKEEKKVFRKNSETNFFNYF